MMKIRTIFEHVGEAVEARFHRSRRNSPRTESNSSPGESNGSSNSDSPNVNDEGVQEINDENKPLVGSLITSRSKGKGKFTRKKAKFDLESLPTRWVTTKPPILHSPKLPASTKANGETIASSVGVQTNGHSHNGVSDELKQSSLNGHMVRRTEPKHQAKLQSQSLSLHLTTYLQHSKVEGDHFSKSSSLSSSGKPHSMVKGQILRLDHAYDPPLLLAADGIEYRVPKPRINRTRTAEQPKSITQHPNGKTQDSEVEELSPPTCSTPEHCPVSSQPESHKPTSNAKGRVHLVSSAKALDDNRPSIMEALAREILRLKSQDSDQDSDADSVSRWLRAASSSPPEEPPEEEVPRITPHWQHYRLMREIPIGPPTLEQHLANEAQELHAEQAAIIRGTIRCEWRFKFQQKRARMEGRERDAFRREREREWKMERREWRRGEKRKNKRKEKKKRANMEKKPKRRELLRKLLTKKGAAPAAAVAAAAVEMDEAEGWGRPHGEILVNVSVDVDVATVNGGGGGVGGDDQQQPRQPSPPTTLTVIRPGEQDVVTAAEGRGEEEEKIQQHQQQQQAEEEGNPTAANIPGTRMDYHIDATVAAEGGKGEDEEEEEEGMARHWEKRWCHGARVPIASNREARKIRKTRAVLRGLAPMGRWLGDGAPCSDMLVENGAEARRSVRFYEAEEYTTGIYDLEE